MIGTSLGRQKCLDWFSRCLVLPSGSPLPPRSQDEQSERERRESLVGGMANQLLDACGLDAALEVMSETHGSQRTCRIGAGPNDEENEEVGAGAYQRLHQETVALLREEGDGDGIGPKRQKALKLMKRHERERMLNVLHVNSRSKLVGACLCVCARVRVRVRVGVVRVCMCVCVGGGTDGVRVVWGVGYGSCGV